jgi:hypothetical protein
MLLESLKCYDYCWIIKAEKLNICCKAILTVSLGPASNASARKLTNAIEQDYYVLCIKQVDIHGI